VSEVLRDWSEVMPSPVEEELEDALNFIIEFCVPIIEKYPQPGTRINKKQREELARKCTWNPIWLLVSSIISPEAKPTFAYDSGRCWGIAWMCWDSTLKARMNNTEVTLEGIIGLNPGQESPSWDVERGDLARDTENNPFVQEFTATHDISEEGDQPINSANIPNGDPIGY